MAFATPYVYKTNPGNNTALAYLDGVNLMLTHGGGSNPHHWTVISYTYPELKIQCTANPQRVIRYYANVTYNIQCFVSLDGGTTYLNTTAVNICNDYAISSYRMNSTSYGASKTLMYLMEVEDAIMISSSHEGVTGIGVGSLAQSLIAGRIAYTQNKNDEALGIYGEGAWGGTPGLYATSNQFAWLGAGTSGTGGNFLYWGTQVKSMYANYLASTTDTNPFLKDVFGGAMPQGTRFVPFPISGGTGAGDPGLACYSKYLRARNYGVGYSDPVYAPSPATIQNGQVIPSPDPNVWWKHNKPYTASHLNGVVIWCDPVNEVLVP